MEQIKVKTDIVAIIVCIFFIAGVEWAEAKIQLPLQEQNTNRYWKNYGAEITRYQLKQARYGKIRQGNALFIYVTEPFLPQTQVKDDGIQSKNNEKAVLILKLNAIKRFKTGLYDYSVMQSVFSSMKAQQENNENTKPLVYRPLVYKLTTSIQDWCGHVWSQFNLKTNYYQAKQYSYFQQEGDATYKLTNVLLEEELLMRLRLNVQLLPVGKLTIIPSSVFMRLKHVRVQKYFATATLTTTNVQGKLYYTYQLVYEGELQRRLLLRFRKKFPHDIDYWEETYVSGFGANAKTLTTKAKRTHAIMVPYWNKNRLQDKKLRRKLGLLDSI